MQDGHIKGEKMADIQELIPDPAILITGLRDTGYDFNTSLEIGRASCRERV